MKAKVVGGSAWQKKPLAGVLDIEIAGRYVDSEGRATVSHYSAVLDVSGDVARWVNALKPAENLWIIVQGPDDPPGPLAVFREVVSYSDEHAVTTEFKRRLVSSDLDGLIFDYAQVDSSQLPGFGDAPLSMRAAAEAIERITGLSGTQAQRRAYDRSQIKVKTQWNVTEAPYPTYWYTPGDTSWRDSSGNDPDAAAPPPDTGAY